MRDRSEAARVPINALAPSGPKPSSVQRVCSSSARIRGAAMSAATMQTTGIAKREELKNLLMR
jgi:hypothetical protein